MSVTAAGGFRAAGVAAGLKSSGQPDVALVRNDGPLDIAAGVFTTNRIKAAPVLWTQQALADGRLAAVLLNSGGANACTGPQGFADTHRSAEQAAAALGVGAGDVAVCSTGLIGERLPMAALVDGIGAAAAALSADGGPAAADAIRTTDTVSKQAVQHLGDWTVGGMAKGAGMLAPGMATLLAVLTTDAVVDGPTLATALAAATRVTFDRIDADGCMSTNDTVLALASGASGTTPAPEKLAAALQTVCADLAGQLVADAEGATKQVRIQVLGAASEDDAVEVGRSVARSNLLKCALFGNDPNWGRVLAAVGTTAAAFQPDEVDVAINGVPVCRNGAAGADRSLVDLRDRQVHIAVDLHAGVHDATIWTTDLSHGYVEENSAYPT